VTPIFTAGPAILDYPVDGTVEEIAGFQKPVIRWEGQLLEQTGERYRDPVEELHYLGQRVTNLPGLRLNVGIKDRFAYDGQRQPDHFLVDKQRFPIGPSFPRADSVADHRICVGIDALAMECGLRKPALPPVELVLARKQSLTEQLLGHLQPTALVEQPAVGHQHVPYVVWMIEQIKILGSELEMDYIAVLA